MIRQDTKMIETQLSAELEQPFHFFIFYFHVCETGRKSKKGLLNFKLPDTLYCGKVPFLGLHEGPTSENGLLACEKTRNIPGSLQNIAALWEFV